MKARSRLRPALLAPAALLLALATAACGGDDEDTPQQGQPEPGQSRQGQQEQVLPAPQQGQQGQQGQQQQQAIAEYRQVSQRLQQIRQRAMQDSGLRARRDSLVQAVRDRMRDQSDTTAARMDRMDELGQEMQAAREAQDTTRMQEIQGEARSLNRALRAAQEQVMQDPDVRQRVEAFQEAVRDEMREVEPSADSLLSLADSLRALLQQQMGSGPGPGG